MRRKINSKIEKFNFNGEWFEYFGYILFMSRQCMQNNCVDKMTIVFAVVSSM